MATTIKQILEKLKQGEGAMPQTFTEEEKDFIAKFDMDDTLHKNAAAARRKAEEELGKTNARLAETEAKLKAAEDKAAQSTQTGDATVKELQRQLNTLQKKFDEADAKVKVQARAETIRARAKELGIACSKGMSEKSFFKLLEDAIGDVDVNQPEALTSRLETFKNENPAIIAADVMGGSGIQGGNSDGYKPAVNPYKPETLNYTDQGRVEAENPQLARQLRAEANYQDPIT